MSKLFKLTTLAVAMTSALFSGTVFAQETVEVHTLDPIVVTASKTEQNASQVPARINVIDKKTIEQNPISNLDNVLKNDASANIVTSGGIGQTSSVFLRGTNASHTLILRDGMRLNSASTGSASLPFIDVSDIQRVEVLKGASSVLYGSDAIGGVVQLISQKPQKTGGFITGVYGENDTYKAIVGADVAQNGFYAQVRGQKVESDGTPVVGKQDFDKKSGYEQKGGSAKIGYEHDRFAISADYARNQGTNEYINYSWNIFDYQPVSHDFKNESVNIKGRVNINDQFGLNARLSQVKDELNQNDLNAENQYDKVHNTNQEAEIHATWQVTPQQNILAGVTHQKQKGDVYSGGWSTVRYNETVDSTGYFAQHQYNSDKVNTQVGVRLEDNEKYGTHTVGQGAIRYHFTPNTSIYTNIGSAFKAPTTNQLYATAWGGNPNLKPEESVSYEIGLDQKVGQYTTLGLSAYRTNVDNLIAWSSGQNININKATYTGSELSANWKLNDYFIRTSYNYVRAKNDTTKQDLARRPRHNGVISFGVENEQYGISTSIQAKSKSKDWSAQYDNPSYMTLGFNGYWNINQHIKLFGNIDNLLDEKYKTAYEGSVGGVYYRDGGRQANIGATFRY